MAIKNNERVNFSKTQLKLEYPDLLGIQLQSFKDFFQLETTPENRQNEGLYRVFTENFPISDARNIFVLEFLDYFVDPPSLFPADCKAPMTFFAGDCNKPMISPMSSSFVLSFDNSSSEASPV